MLLRVASMGSIAAATSLGWFVWRVDQGIAVDTVRTEVFTLVALTQWFNMLNCRSAFASAFGPGLFANRWLIAGLAASITLLAAVLYWPPLATLFHTVPLQPIDVLPLVALASTVLWAEEARKAIARRMARNRRRLFHQQTIVS